MTESYTLTESQLAALRSLDSVWIFSDKKRWNASCKKLVAMGLAENCDLVSPAYRLTEKGQQLKALWEPQP